MASIEAIDERRQRRRWSVWLVAGLAGLGGWVASGYLSSTASPTTQTGFVVAQGDPNDPEGSNLGWHAIMLDDRDDPSFLDDGQGFSLAGVWWRDTEENWTHWGGPADPAPDCLIEGVPVRATIGYVNVRQGVDGFAGTRRAVWMHCMEDAPAQP